MADLQPPDTHHLSSAIGWLELGNATEAALDLERVSAQAQQEPDVLEVRWAIYAGQKNWEQALQSAETLVQAHPERSSGWLHRAYALRRVPHGGLQLAWAALRPAYDKFSKVPIIAYNLACYAAQFGRMDEAWDWFQKALETGDRARIKAMALADDDLRALQDRIRKL